MFAGGSPNHYGYVLQDSVNGVDINGLKMRVCRRPLDIFGKELLYSLDPIILFNDALNLGFYHEQFNSDIKPLDKTNIGFNKAGDAKGRVGHEEITQYDYSCESKTYPDEIINKIGNDLKRKYDGTYFVGGNNIIPGNNCQQFVNDVLNRYEQSIQPNLREIGAPKLRPIK